MKKAQKLILDSGGTRTDCCIFYDDLTSEFFSVKSYHPKQFSDAFFQEMKDFWLKKIETTTEIYFYGTGCSLPLNQQRIKKHFKELTKGEIIVESDVFGACKTIFNQQSGILCIMGTGSVAVVYDGNTIVEQFGGLGYLLGDEGSGYAVGRKLINAVLKKEVPSSIIATWPSDLIERTYLLSNVYGKEGKRFISSFAQQLPKSSFLDEIHFENISEFFESFKSRIIESKLNVSIVGSYGYFHSEVIEMWFLEQNLAKPSYIQYPIQAMASFYSKNR